MRPAAAVALALAITLPALAQRGGGGHTGYASHGTSAAHGAPTFHGSYAPSAPMHYAYSGGSYSGAAMAHAPVSYPSSMRLIAPGVRYPARAPIIRPTFYHPTHPITVTHNFYIHTYPVYPYLYSYPSYVYGYLPPDLLDDSFNNYDSSVQPQPQPQPDYSYAYPEPMPQPDNGYPQPMPQPGYTYPANPEPQPAPQGAYAYPSASPGYEAYVPQPAAPQMQYAPGSASTVILIFRDGRPPEQIQNYLATRSTLTVLDGGRRREIPISDLDLPATMSANQQTGVDFQLPASR